MTEDQVVSQIQSMFAVQGNGEPGVKCPFCGYENVHVRSPLDYGDENKEAKDFYVMKVRGAVIVVPFWGECGHEWALVFGEHKGNVEARIVQTAIPAPTENTSPED